MMMSRAIRLFTLLLPVMAFGQEKPARHTLRILPLGDPPPYLQEVRNGVRYEVPPAEGTIPPRNVEISTSAEDGETAKLRLRLGLVSEPLVFPLPETRVVEARQGPDAVWLKIPLSNSEASLALVWRSGPDWSKVRVLTLPDGTAERSRGDCRFINVTARPMAITWGEERLKLDPGAAMTRGMPSGSNEVEVSILYPAIDGTLTPCLSTKIGSKAGALHQFIIYAADEKKPRMPVKVLPLEERR